MPPRAPRVIRRRHAGAWLALTLALLAVVAGTVAWRLVRSDFFVVSRLHVTGSANLDPNTVLNRAGVLGKQLYAVDEAAAAASIEKLPLVRSARIRRIWPNEIAITIQEREPWGTWQIGGVNYLVDNTGVVLDIVSQPRATNIYELDAAPGLQPGDHVNADAVRMAQALLSELPHTISQRFAKLEYSSEDGLELLTDQGVRIRLGDSQGLNYKLSVWQALNAKVGAGQLHLIDLRSIDRPYYR